MLDMHMLRSYMVGQKVLDHRVDDQSDIMSWYHEELAPQARTSQALHTIYKDAVHEDPVIFAEKRKADGYTYDDDEHVRRRRPRGYADDAFGMRDEPYPCQRGLRHLSPELIKHPQPTDALPKTLQILYLRQHHAQRQPHTGPLTTRNSQLQQPPLKMTVQTYTNTCDDNTYKAIMEAFKRESEPSPAPPPPPAAAAGPSAAVHSTACTMVSRSLTQPQKNLHSSKGKPGCLTIPVKVNSVIFNKGRVDTGASHSMSSQGAVCKLGLWDDIYKDRMQGYGTASGDHVKPWGMTLTLK